MAYHDTYRVGAHAVITNDKHEILLLKATYANKSWGLPGGALDIGETIHEALHRECHEELGAAIHADYLSGVYYHSQSNSHVFIFRAHLIDTHAKIILSEEHSAYQYTPLNALSAIQKHRVTDCLNFMGMVKSFRF